MTKTAEQTLDLPLRPKQCVECGHFVAPSEMRCPNCGHLFDVVTPVAPPAPLTVPVTRRPQTVPDEPWAPDVLAPGTPVLLQFLPSGASLFLALDAPLILGRGTHPGEHRLIDLAEFGAGQHGVSRQHCLLQRSANRLLVRDLNSTNGTYLNHEFLTPFKDYPVAHGDRLILGTLHVLVAFDG